MCIIYVFYKKSNYFPFDENRMELISITIDIFNCGLIRFFKSIFLKLENILGGYIVIKGFIGVPCNTLRIICGNRVIQNITLDESLIANWYIN